MTPKIGSRYSDFQIAVPGGAPGDQFKSQAYFGAYDPITNRYYFVTCRAASWGNRHGAFYIDKPGGTVHLLAAPPTDFQEQRVYFTGTSANRTMWSGNARIDISAPLAPEGVA